MTKKRKYYLFTASTNTEDNKIFNCTIFVDGYEMPSWKTIEEKVCDNIKACGCEPKENTTIILFMAKLTKQEYEALQNKEG